MKLLVVGDRGVGKSAFVELISKGAYHYAPERVPHMWFDTTSGSLDCLFHEIAEHESVASSPIGIQADGAFIVFDVNARNPFENVLKRYYDIVRVCGDIPVVLCGNKADGNVRNQSVKQLRLNRNVVLSCFTISCRCTDSDEETLCLPEPLVWLVYKAAGVEPPEDIKVEISNSMREPVPVVTAADLAELEAYNAAQAGVPYSDDDL